MGYTCGAKLGGQTSFGVRWCARVPWSASGPSLHVFWGKGRCTLICLYCDGLNLLSMSSMTTDTPVDFPKLKQKCWERQPAIGLEDLYVELLGHMWCMRIVSHFGKSMQDVLSAGRRLFDFFFGVLKYLYEPQGRSKSYFRSARKIHVMHPVSKGVVFLLWRDKREFSHDWNKKNGQILCQTFCNVAAFPTGHNGANLCVLEGKSGRSEHSKRKELTHQTKWTYWTLLVCAPALQTEEGEGCRGLGVSSLFRHP